MSPEVIKGKTILTNDLQKIDLFYFGITLYVLDFGCYSFNFTKGDNDEEIYQKINREWKVTSENIIFSRHFIDLLNGLLEKDVNKRINIFQALNSYFVQGAKILLTPIYSSPLKFLYTLFLHFLKLVYYNTIFN